MWDDEEDRCLILWYVDYYKLGATWVNAYPHDDYFWAEDEVGDYYMELGKDAFQTEQEALSALAIHIINEREKLDSALKVILKKGSATKGLMITAQKFLTKLYELIDVGNLDNETDWIAREIDTLLWEGGFSEVDTILQQVDITKLNTFHMRSLLTMTYAARIALPTRPAFYQKVRSEFLLLKGEERTNKIIGTLE